MTCLVDQFFPRIGLDTVRVLERLGLEVHFDPRQTCCSQPAHNAGLQAEAARVAGHFLDVYAAGREPIVVPSGSCAAMLKVALPRLFGEGSSRRDQARQVAERVWELSDFLVNRLGVESTGAALEARVAYHDSCHSLRELGLREEPRRLVRAVLGVELVELPNSDRCCGFGGTFSVDFPEISVSLGREKLDRIRASGADWVVASDASCLMHLESIARACGQPIRTMHLAELLARRREVPA